MSLVVVFAAGTAVGDVLFPLPIHLTRQVHDSIGGTTATVEQFCYGNRVVSVNGTRTSIADYDKNELTEIDREDGTYSVTRFDDVAKALAYGVPKGEATQAQWKVKSGGLEQLRTNRANAAFEAELDEGTTKRRTRIAVDRTVSLSKDALDVLIGAAYPNSRKAEDAVVLQAAKGQKDYALPVEQHTTITLGEDRAEMSDVVIRVGSELVPPDLIAVPPDAKLVESRVLQRMHALQQLENAQR
ncbi:MAG TPA: hypothetical protein VFP80_02870 [Thermoanaerobaculia bacterium]|nr:hypothetical protein [Thermoanaerobaculia bacterium]